MRYPLTTVAFGVALAAAIGIAIAVPPPAGAHDPPHQPTAQRCLLVQVIRDPPPFAGMVQSSLRSVCTEAAPPTFYPPPPPFPFLQPSPKYMHYRTDDRKEAPDE